MRDERRTVNSKTEFTAAQANLSFHQLGAMGLIAPKAVMMWFPPGDEAADLRHGNFAWDQTIYNAVALGSLPSYISSYVVNGVGDYTLTFANQVLGRPDDDGIQQLEVLSFQFAMGDVNLSGGGVRGFFNVTLVNPQTFNIEITRSAVPSHQPYVIAVF